MPNMSPAQSVKELKQLIQQVTKYPLALQNSQAFRDLCEKVTYLCHENPAARFEIKGFKELPKALEPLKKAEKDKQFKTVLSDIQIDMSDEEALEKQISLLKEIKKELKDVNKKLMALKKDPSIKNKKAFNKSYDNLLRLIRHSNDLCHTKDRARTNAEQIAPKPKEKPKAAPGEDLVDKVRQQIMGFGKEDYIGITRVGGGHWTLLQGIRQDKAGELDFTRGHATETEREEAQKEVQEQLQDSIDQTLEIRISLTSPATRLTTPFDTTPHPK